VAADFSSLLTGWRPTAAAPQDPPPRRLASDCLAPQSAGLSGGTRRALTVPGSVSARSCCLPCDRPPPPAWWARLRQSVVGGPGVPKQRDGVQLSWDGCGLAEVAGGVRVRVAATGREYVKGTCPARKLRRVSGRRPCLGRFVMTASAPYWLKPGRAHPRMASPFPPFCVAPLLLLRRLGLQPPSAAAA
jgi:hypothetical protein